jgi:WhiB family redox-sensing transcriptional regulator
VTSTYGTSYASAGETWRQRAACRNENPDLFFGPEGETRPQRDIRERKAKAVCAPCPVRSDCLSLALRHGAKHGTWGGLGVAEREREATAQAVRQRLAVTLAARRPTTHTYQEATR